MKKLVLFVLCSCSILAMAAENLLPKYKFNARTGIPEYWYPSNGSPAEVERSKQGELIFRNTMKTAKDKRIFWQLRPLDKVKAGVHYRMTVKARSEAPMQASITVEGASPWQTIGKGIQLTPEWKVYTLEFKFKPFQKPPYFLFWLASPGKAEFIPVTLEECAENFVLNANFAELNKQNLPSGWNAGKNVKAERVVLPNGKFGVKLYGKGKGLNFIQRGLKIKAQEEYEFSVRVQGKTGTVARAYVECSQPWFDCSKRITCNGSWQEIRMTVKFAKLGKPAYLVLDLCNDGEAVFAEPQLILKKKLSETPISRESVKNDFENGKDGWVLTNAEIIHAGGGHGNVLQLNGTSAKAFARLGKIKLQDGEPYTLSYDVRGGNDEKYTDSQNATWFRISLQSKGKPLPGTEGYLDSFSSWQHKNITFIPQSNVTADLVCELRSPGTVCFDNISLNKGGITERPLTLVLDNPAAFRNTLDLELTGIPAKISGRINTSKQVKNYTVTFGKISKTLPISQSFSFEVQKTGDYPISVSIPGAEPVKRIIKVTRGAKPKIAFRDDNVMLLDGKPFFMLLAGGTIIQTKTPYPEKMRKFAEYGFNTICCGDEDQLNAAAEAGFFTIVRSVEKFPAFSSEFQRNAWKRFYRSEMRRLCSHPSVIAVFYTDEPAWRGLPVAPLEEMYNFLRDAVPEYPLWLNEAPRGKVKNLRLYADISDIYGVDIYPIPTPNPHSDLDDKMMTSVGRYTEICNEVSRGNKPVLMALQAFSWGALNNRKVRIYPTHEENRFMAYNAILHGATALEFWGLGWGEENWDFVKVLGKTVKELQSLSPVLTARSVRPCTLTASVPEIRLMQKRINGINYFIAINESGKNLNVVLKGTGKLKVFFENRYVNGSDSFAPWGVHIYSDGESLPQPYSYRKNGRVAAATQRSSREIPGVNWIWYPGTYKQRESKAVFLRDFTLKERPVKAELFATADDFMKASVNGKTVIEHVHNRTHAIFSVADVTGLLKAGQNRIVIKAMDSGTAPCGLIYALKMTGRDGKTTLLVSDSKTLAVNGTALPENLSQMKASEVIAPLGKGPWGAAERQIQPVQKECIDRMGFPF